MDDLRRGVTTALATVLAATVLPAASWAQAAPQASPPAEAATPAPYRQTPGVRARLGDVPIRMDAPGLAPDRTTFTSQSEMEAHLLALKARDPGVWLGSLGRTSQGRDLPWLIFTAEGLQDLERIRALDRPVVWLVGQQHGNEPAGGEAMLALASALTDGELEPLLDRLTVVVVPRANPDGAEADTRRNGQDYDLNRDHLLLSQPETQAIQRAMTLLPPDLVVDAHEYGAGGSLRRFGGLQRADQTILDSTHPGVPAQVNALARADYLPSMTARLDDGGLSSSVYYSAIPGEGPISTGGTAPGISRNFYGLTGAISILLESRNGPGSRREAFQRRVASHYLAAAGAMEAAAREPERLRRTVAEARQALAASSDALPVRYEASVQPGAIALMDPQTGEPRDVDVLVRDSRQMVVNESRPRPTGYLLAPAAASAIEAFRLRGYRMCAARPAEVAVEAFYVTRTEPITRATREASTLSDALQVRIEPSRVQVGDGWLWTPMDQPGASVIAASLEPDSVGSHVHVGLAPVAEDGVAPIFRVVGAPPPADPC